MAPPVRHPGIFQVGTVREVDGAIEIRGWGLTSCASRCPCHLSPAGNMHLYSNEEYGWLGLISFTTDCKCCTPWTAHELLGIARDLEPGALDRETA